ncbi:hypothetical protein [Streptomyces sp. NBC_01198]|uniref:hypothetical protein n=1 Tax=Streptomyces sp. NBC_01198 TaxID=2903769 RepID=UPI002E143CE6|nr:hypothetical protein OG702_13660 [Streptomyces sp. NBC_01198]
MTMTETGSTTAPHLVPLAAQARHSGIGAAVGGAVALAVLLPAADSADWQGTKAVGQLALTALLIALWAYQQFGARSRARVARDYAAAVPAPDTLWHDQTGRRKDLRRGTVVMGLVAAGWALVCADYVHLPLVGLAFPLMMLLGILQARQTTRWERDYGVVLWKPALTVVGPGAYGSAPCYSTRPEVTPQP